MQRCRPKAAAADVEAPDNIPAESMLAVDARLFAYDRRAFGHQMQPESSNHNDI